MPWIIADADTGHGGDAHVRNLIRRFVEVGVPGYHIEDQKPGAKKCGHQGGKVLVQSDEQIKRLNAARFQLDIMGVGGIIVARTDAEAASLLDGGSDERDQPFVLGATNTEVPPYKFAFLAVLKRLHDAGMTELNGHLLYEIPTGRLADAEAWLSAAGILQHADEAAAAYLASPGGLADTTLDAVADEFVDAWESAAGIMTYGQAVAEEMSFRAEQGEQLDMTVDEWLHFAGTASLYDARAKALALGLTVSWEAELAKTPEGYFQIRAGIPYAVAKSLAAAPFADILWMETKTANLAEAKEFADAIHAVYPEQMLAYNLSPSFSWDTTGMTDEEMTAFPAEIGKLGFVFNFITYGGHQVDGMASEEFATALQDEGMLALANFSGNSDSSSRRTAPHKPSWAAPRRCRASRRFRANRNHPGDGQGFHPVPAPRPDGGAATAARRLAGDLDRSPWHRSPAHRVAPPASAGSEILELQVNDNKGVTVADVIFAQLHDRRNRSILSVRDQNVYDESLRRKRLMTLLHLFVLHRYKVESIHYLTPTDDNRRMAENLLQLSIFESIGEEVGEIIVAEVNRNTVGGLVGDNDDALNQLITKV